jgi:hypothetical protein
MFTITEKLRLNELIAGSDQINGVYAGFRTDLKFRKEALVSPRWPAGKNSVAPIHI